MLWLDVASRVVHIATAITLVGGSVFTLCVLMPSIKELGDTERSAFQSAVTGRWKKFVHLGVLLFLVSGIYNYSRAIPNHRGDGFYHALIGIKMLVALCVFYLSAALVGRSEKLEFIRANRGRYLKLLVTLAIAIVCISGYAKVRPYPPAVPGTAVPGSSLAGDR